MHFNHQNFTDKEKSNQNCTLIFSSFFLIEHLFTEKQDKGEQTDLNEADFELDDYLLESNNIVITQNKDGYVLHVQKLGNVTEEAVVAAAQAAAGNEHTQLTSVQELKPHLTTLQTSHAIKLPSSECGKLFFLFIL